MVKAATALLALFVMAHASAALGADKRYPVTYVQRIDVSAEVDRTAFEDKAYLNCDDFKLTESDVRFALRHMQKVSYAHFRDQLVSVGCVGQASVVFKNGKVLHMGIEPTGRISAAEENAKAGEGLYYSCAPCRVQMASRLKPVMQRTQERREPESLPKDGQPRR